MLERYFTSDSFERSYQDYLREHRHPRTDKPRIIPGFERLSSRFYARTSLREQIFLSTIRKVSQGRYTFNPFSVTYIDKRGGGKRKIAKCGLKDYLVQNALNHCLNDIYERQFSSSSFAYRPKLGPKPATLAVRSFVENGVSFFLFGDIKDFFDQIDHALLLHKLRKDIPDERLIRLIYRYLRTPAVPNELLEYARDRSRFPVNEKGVPQGGALSGMLSNIFLTDLDQEISRHFPNYVRYADNFVIGVSQEQDAREALSMVGKLLSDLQLEIHGEPKTQICSIEQGFEFLGFYHRKDRFSPAVSSVKRFKERMSRSLMSYIPTLDDEWDLASLVFRANRVIEGRNGRSWGAYYCLSRDVGLFKRLDKWIGTQVLHAARVKINRRYRYVDLKDRGLRSMVNGYYRRFKFPIEKELTEKGSGV